MVWLECGGYERCLEVWTRLIGEGLRGLGNLAVGGAGGGSQDWYLSRDKCFQLRFWVVCPFVS